MSILIFKIFFNNTLVENINLLMPGNYAELDFSNINNCKYKISQYWDFFPIYHH